MPKLEKPKKLGPEEKEMIYQMFFGPFKDEWRDRGGLVDNSDIAIANRLNLSLQQVSGYIALILEKHFIRVRELRDKERGKETGK